MDELRKQGIFCPLNDQVVCPLLEENRRLKKEIGRLRELSQTDPLTGLFNLRYLFRALEGEMERTRRVGLPTGLIMIDLDHFKDINDTYGHEFGNEALRRTSKVWKENIRRIDIPCRYGGEEFAIILPTTGLQQALSTANRLRNSLEKSAFYCDTERVRLTASMGVEVYDKNEGDIPVKDFIKKADSFLLEAKAMGRNLVFYDKNRMDRKEDGITEEERQALFIKRSRRT